MKKNRATKILVLIAACFLVLGIAFSIVGYALGGIYLKNVKTDSLNESINQTVTALDISINYGTFKIIKSDEFKIIANNFKENTLSCEIKNGKLTIKEQSSNWFNFDVMFLWGKHTPELTVYIKGGVIFQNVSIDVGAGELSINDVSASNLVLECGAGKVGGNNITADKSKLSNGAGEMDLKNVDLKNSNISCGAGKVGLSGKLSGETKIDNGVGQTQLNINGAKNDYYINASNGVGKVSINGSDYRKDDFDKNAGNTINVSNGVGEVGITFHNQQ